MSGRRLVTLLGPVLLACAAEPTADDASSGAGGQSTIAGSGGDGAGLGAAGSGGVAINAGTAGIPAVAGGTGSGGTAGEGIAGVSGTAGGSAGSAGAANNGGSGGSPVVSGGAAGAAGDSSGKVVLFDGTSLDAWQSVNGGPPRWRLLSDVSAMEVAPGTGNIVTRQKFESLLLHIEYWTPQYPSSVTGQSRGNSGIYFKRAYELQVLDTFGVPLADDTCGAVYDTSAPLVSACFGAETWNTYDIEFRSSVWDAQGVKTAPAVIVSAHLNDRLVQQNVTLTLDPTPSGNADAPGPQPLMLQDHDPQGRVRYRNIWAVPR